MIFGPDHDLGKIEKLLSAAIGAAKHHIRILTPYFLPDERIGFLLELAALRGIMVELILPQRTDLCFLIGPVTVNWPIWIWRVFAAGALALYLIIQNS